MTPYAQTPRAALRSRPPRCERSVVALLAAVLLVLFAAIDLALAGRLGTSDLRLLVLLEVVGGLVALGVVGLLLGPVLARALRPPTAGVEAAPGRTAPGFDAVLDELEHSAAAAAAAAAALRAYFGAASQELQTPLAGLRRSAEDLLQADRDPEERERLAVSMVAQTREAGRLVEDLVVVAKLDGSGGVDDLELAREPTDLVVLAAEEVGRAALLTPDRVYEVTVDGLLPDAADSLVVPGDPLRLGQALANVLDNARYATAAGGRIHVDVRRQGALALVTLWDSGPGVPAQDREVIFTQGAAREGGAPRTAGAGVGLPIARALARAHGGDVTCLDRRGEPGGCFQLQLPAPSRP